MTLGFVIRKLGTKVFCGKRASKSLSKCEYTSDSLTKRNRASESISNIFSLEFLKRLIPSVLQGNEPIKAKLVLAAANISLLVH
ncbi:hypothetical protein KSF78_0004041 [Schistosoma japonicum]|nr:hypothetical protein KSF78_0004041 [Schistosoma japonicum]